MGRRLQLHMGQLGGPAGQGLHRQAQAGHDHAAPVAALTVDDRQGGGGAEIEHQQGLGIPGLGPHRAHHQVAAQLGGVVDSDVQSGLDAAAHQHGGQTAQHSDRPHQDGLELRHHRGHDGPVHAFGVDAPQREDIGQEHGVFVLGLGAVRRHPGGKADGILLHAPQNDVGIAHVDGQQHTANLLFRPVEKDENGQARSRLVFWEDGASRVFISAR